MEELKNASKHLDEALGIFNKGKLSGCWAQLGDAHFLPGVVGDIKGSFKDTEISYRANIEGYGKSPGVKDNPKYSTGIENMQENVRRKKSLVAAVV